MTPVILQPGDGQYAVAADGATLRLDADGAIWRNGFRFIVGGITLAAACFGIYGQSLFARGKTDGKLWLATVNGWQEVTDVASVDPEFFQRLMGQSNEPT